MYLIPAEWARAIGVEIARPYNMIDYHCAEVGDADGERVSQYVERLSHSENLEYLNANPMASAMISTQTISSNKSGPEGVFKCIFSYFCDDAYMENLATTELRQTPRYNVLSGMEKPRFNHDAVVSLLHKMSHPEAEAAVVDESGDEEAVAESDEVDQLLKNIGGVRSDMVRKICPNGKSVIHPKDFYVGDECYSEMTEASGRHLIIVCTPGQHKALGKVSDEFVVAHINPDAMALTNTSFSIATEDKVSDRLPCLGQFCLRSLAPTRNKSEGRSRFYGMDRLWVDEATGVTYAGRSGNYIYIMVVYKENDYSAVFGRIAKKWKSRVSTKAEDEAAMKQIVTIDRNNFVKMSREGSNVYIKEIKNKLEVIAKANTEAQQRLMESMKMQRQLQEIIDGFDPDKYNEKIIAKAQAQFDAVLSMPKVKSMYTLEDGKIVVITHSINCEDPRTHKVHNIGKLMITLNMLLPKYSGNGNVLVKNLTQMVEGYNGCLMVAPHIYEDGNMCHGSLFSMISQHYGEGNVYAVMEDLLAFVETVNVEDSAGEAIINWPVVGDVHADAGEVDGVEDVDDIELMKNLKGGV